MFLFDNKPVVHDSNPFLYPGGISVTIRRLDAIDPIFGGNKWFKLSLNLKVLKNEGFSKLVTFGGAFSNHLAAVARVGKLEGIKTVGIVRGESSLSESITLKRARNDGMHLIFISRSEYRNKNDLKFLENILPDFQNYYLIPEGGSNSAGVEGCRSIISEDDAQFDQVIIACGTGATAAGIISSLKKDQHLIGISVLKDEGSTEKAINEFLKHIPQKENNNNWHIEHDFHFGGYAKSNDELNAFVKSFSEKTGIMIETVYTGKMFWGLEKLIHLGKFKPDSKILSIHTGGLQYLLSN